MQAAALLGRSRPARSPFPWLALLDGTFLSVPDGEVHRIPAAAPGDSHCHGSVGGWLFLEHLDAASGVFSLSLTNPFSEDDVVRLPDADAIWRHEPLDDHDAARRPILHKPPVPDEEDRMKHSRTFSFNLKCMKQTWPPILACSGDGSILWEAKHSLLAPAPSSSRLLSVELSQIASTSSATTIGTFLSRSSPRLRRVRHEKWDGRAYVCRRLRRCGQKMLAKGVRKKSSIRPVRDGSSPPEAM
ncbi:uncharacterized protein LOC105914177 [Setaria italica]|uniref:uncharacterized protein LOC105914177 n=1 Tax=Setaria italica TaxID=4555 RepID=UPI000BE604F5|nr:uncharacterized protein LOC105914177 [Setaria italica]